MEEAQFYEKLEDNKVRCLLCPHRCLISEGKRGICGVRENREGKLYSLVYGKAVAANIDPIEKKPFFHFYPGSTSFSLATVGCNFACVFCQNSDLSQGIKKEAEQALQLQVTSKEIWGRDLSPEEIVERALHYGCQSISYTYTEPTIFYEYAYSTAILAKEKGLKNNFVTNGYINEEPLRKISPFLDAANVDLKSFREDFYKKMCGGHLEPVLKTLRLMKELGIWVEVTTLIIPGYNDSQEEIKEIANFIKGLGAETPWHISRFFPTYKLLDASPTPISTLKRARELGKEIGLRYIYTGNIPGDEGENTYCYNCGKLVIKRFGFEVLENRLKDSRCPFCSTPIDGRGL